MALIPIPTKAIPPMPIQSQVGMPPDSLFGSGGGRIEGTADDFKAVGGPGGCGLVFN